MTPRQAAKIIGCDVSQVRRLVANGQIPTEQYQMPGGFYYDIKRQDAEAYASKPQSSGYPRGKKRKEN